MGDVVAGVVDGGLDPSAGLSSYFSYSVKIP